MAHRDGETSTPRLVVLLSGGGRTLLNLADNIDAGQLRAEIALVIASRPCVGVERARARGFDTRVIAGDIPAAALERLLDDARADWVALAGYLRLVAIPQAYKGKVVNIHPALLPRFGGPGMYGAKAHQAVLDAGARESGCTVHLCDSGYDTGPIVLQKRCPVLPDDTVKTLADRVFALEKLAYPEALRLLFADARQSARVKP